MFLLGIGVYASSKLKRNIKKTSISVNRGSHLISNSIFCTAGVSLFSPSKTVQYFKIFQFLEGFFNATVQAPKLQGLTFPSGKDVGRNSCNSFPENMHYVNVGR